MAETQTKLRAVAPPGDDIAHLRAELDALRYENNKLRTINEVLMQRVELGWGNFSTAYSAFQKAAMLTEKVATKALKLQQTQSRLDEATLDLTRTRLEKEVTHQRLSDLLESISDAVVLFDQNRRLVLANSHFYEFWSGTGATIVAGETRLVDLIPMSIRYGIFEPRSTPPERPGATEEGRKDSVFRLTNGRWLQMSERPTSDGGLAVVYTDITAVKEEEFRERERVIGEKSVILQSTLDNLPQGVSLVSADNRLEAWNQRFIELSGVKPTAVRQGVDFTTLLRDCEIGAEVADLRELLCDCDPETGFCEQEKELTNGTVLDIRSHPVLGGGFVVTYTDITERSRNASALRESERRLRLITDAMPALISYINSERRYEFANKTFEQWFDRPSVEIEGQYMWQVLGDTEYRNHEPYITRALAGDVVNFELEQQLPGPRKRISYKTYVPHYGAKDRVIGFFALEQDVTEKRRTAQALKHAYQHMEQRVFERTRELTELNQTLQREIAERALIEESLLKATREAEQASESKVKFIAAAGHDLLQPLNAARLFSAALQERSLPDGANDLAGSLARSLDDVESIITTLVDISKLEAGVVEPVTEAFEVNELLGTLATEFGVQARQQGLEFRYARSSVVVHSDSQLLARILRNFLTNALRYTDSGKILLGARRRPEGLDIEVADTGVGIPEDQLEVIFGEFQRLDGSHKRDTRGLGLGLAIVDKLSRVLGCEVFVRSLPSRGSVFTVRVPYGRLAQRSADAVILLPELYNLQGRQVLVVDNDEAICLGMETMLGGWGCSVTSAQTIAELDEVIGHSGARPEVAIVDYQLDDDATGFDAVKHIDALLGRSVPVVMITANYTKDLRENVTGSGYHLLNKPVKPHKLRLLLTRLLQDGG
ncbi:MAG: NahK/ErcS family hybrid sensor histidine kinase/response regulator [Halieaceae bacterium]|jgi:PAS domain S-box-containing protein|nr:NahK/ErcS family hybrid sensor histidine kinase/response regulator [Halieaceae bacterium]